MEKSVLRVFLGFSLFICFVNAQQRMATVSGNAFISDSTDHTGIKVLFEAVSASATTDSVYSGTDGSFVIGLTDGLYIVHYSKNGFIPYTLPSTYSWGNDT